MRHWLLGLVLLAGTANAGPVATYEVEIYDVTPFLMSLDYGTAQATVTGPIYNFPISFVVPFQVLEVTPPNLPQFVAGSAGPFDGLSFDLTLHFDTLTSVLGIYGIPGRGFASLRDPIMRVTLLAPEPSVLWLLVPIWAGACWAFLRWCRGNLRGFDHSEQDVRRIMREQTRKDLRRWVGKR